MATIDLVRRERNTKTLKAGEVIFREGEQGNSFFWVDAGEVEIVNHRQFLELIEQGNFFGEMALLNNKPRSATATARTDVRLVEINHGDFYFLIQHSPQFAIEVMQVLAERVRRNTDA
jgi:CRP/FNR family cyclic AMP-dependent transcriptional regulator